MLYVPNVIKPLAPTQTLRFIKLSARQGKPFKYKDCKRYRNKLGLKHHVEIEPTEDEYEPARHICKFRGNTYRWKQGLKFYKEDTHL